MPQCWNWRCQNCDSINCWGKCYAKLQHGIVGKFLSPSDKNLELIFETMKTSMCYFFNFSQFFFFFWDLTLRHWACYERFTVKNKIVQKSCGCKVQSYIDWLLTLFFINVSKRVFKVKLTMYLPIMAILCYAISNIRIRQCKKNIESLLYRFIGTTIVMLLTITLI